MGWGGGSPWGGASALKADGWGAMLGNWAAKSIVEDVVLNRVEDKGNRLNPFDHKMTVGPKGD